MFKQEDDWDDNVFPLAYLITVRAFGTWLHGDERGSVDMHGKNYYGSPDISPNQKLQKIMTENLTQSAVLFNDEQRKVVEIAVKEVCEHRGYYLQALNARTNHVHAVVSAQCKPEIIANAFKSYSTRKLREENLVSSELKLWSRGRSRRYLWKERHVVLAIDYVLYGQGDVPFELDDDE